AVGRAAGDDWLSAAVHAHAAGDAVLGELSIAVAREAGLQAVGRVVEAGMQHTAVAPARVQAAGGFLLYEGDAGARVPVVQLARHREADDTAADDEEIRDPRDAAVGAAGSRR